MQCVEGTKSICYVLQMAAEGRTSPEFLNFLTQSSVEVVKGLTNKTEEVGAKAHHVAFDWIPREPYYSVLRQGTLNPLCCAGRFGLSSFRGWCCRARARSRTLCGTPQVFDAVLDRAETSMQPADSRPCKYLVNALLMAFEVKAMVKPVPKPEMRALMLTLLVKLLDRRVHTLLAHNPQIMRGLNVCMFKILGNNFGCACCCVLPWAFVCVGGERPKPLTRRRRTRQRENGRSTR